MKRSLAVFLIIASFVVGAGAGYIGGFRSSRFGLALDENKVTAANLRANSNFYGGTNLSPKFREYLTARIYCNVYNYFPSDRGCLLQKDWDFGPVDRKVLGAIMVWKDPDQTVWDWKITIKNK
jgi:hypothetical protein